MRSSTSLPCVPIKRGRRALGAVYTGSSGRKAYIAYRKIAHIIRAGEKTVSDAVRKGVAAWSIEEDLLYRLRAEGVQFVGVLCTENKDLWLTTLNTFFDPKLSRADPMGYSRRLVAFPFFCRRVGKSRV
jgi:hypothetical protein